MQKSDPVIKNYIRVVNNAVNKIDGTLGGVQKLEDMLDQLYKNTRASQAFGSDKLTAIDEIHKSARNALNQYIIDNAQNIDVRIAKRKQWNLYRALDELESEAIRESGSSYGRFKQNYPLVDKSVRAGAKATGVGVGLGIIP